MPLLLRNWIAANSLLYGLPKHLLLRLQSIQNTAARVVTRTRKFDHITPVLKRLHWLLVCYRIILKILLLRFTTSVGYLGTTPPHGN